MRPCGLDTPGFLFLQWILPSFKLHQNTLSWFHCSFQVAFWDVCLGRHSNKNIYSYLTENKAHLDRRDNNLNHLYYHRSRTLFFSSLCFLPPSLPPSLSSPLAQALDGFMMMISRDGRILYTSESIANYLGLRQVIYSSVLHLLVSLLLHKQWQWQLHWYTNLIQWCSIYKTLITSM